MPNWLEWIIEWLRPLKCQPPLPPLRPGLRDEIWDKLWAENRRLRKEIECQEESEKSGTTQTA